MGFGSIVRGAMPILDGLLGGQDGVYDDVTIQYWIRDTDEYGTSEYSSAVPVQAVVVRKMEMVKKGDGQMAMSATYLFFPGTQLVPRGTGNGRNEPLDERDIITLSDGTTGPILNDLGLMDQQKMAPFYFEVYLG